MKTTDIIIGPFQDVGPNTINVDLVVESWNHLWFLSEWRADNTEYTLVKMLRKDSDIRSFKSQITRFQARDLIRKLNLKSSRSSLFKSGATWKQ